MANSRGTLGLLCEFFHASDEKRFYANRKKKRARVFDALRTTFEVVPKAD